MSLLVSLFWRLCKGFAEAFLQQALRYDVSSCFIVLAFAFLQQALRYDVSSGVTVLGFV